MNRRQFGKWILRGGILVPFANVRAQIIRPNNLFKPAIVSGGGGATPVFVGITNATNSSGTTIAVARTVTAGNWVIVCVGWEDTTNTSCTVADNSSGSNTFAAGTLSNGQTANLGPLAQLFYGLINSGGSKTFTATFGATTGFNCLSVLEFSGGLSALDVQASSVGAQNNTAGTTGSFTTTAANEALVTVSKDYGGAAATPQASWTEDVDNTGSNGFEIQHRIVSATGTFNGAATYTPAQDYAMVAAGFK